MGCQRPILLLPRDCRLHRPVVENQASLIPNS
jgi:hypothetical protein